MCQKATCFLVEAARIPRIDAQILVRRYQSFLQKETNHRTINDTNSPNNSAINWDTCPVFMFLLLVGYNLSFLPCQQPRFFSAQHVSTIDSPWIPRWIRRRFYQNSACKVVFNFASSTRVLWSRMVRAGTVTCRESRESPLQRIPGYCSEVWFMMIHDLHGEYMWIWWYFEMLR